MEGIYTEPRSCFECYDNGFMVPTIKVCKACKEERKHKAKILKIGVGKHHNKMIILLNNGIIRTVSDRDVSEIKE